MTILASGPGLVVCGHTGVVNRGSRECPLPRGLGKWVGQPIEELPWPILHQYSLWLFDQFDVFEMWAVEDEATRRLSASAHCRRRCWWDAPWWRSPL